jgi:hypothetical protein
LIQIVRDRKYLNNLVQRTKQHVGLQPKEEEEEAAEEEEGGGGGGERGGGEEE